MNKKTIKIVSVLLMAMMLVFCVSNMVFADLDPSSLTGNTSIDTGKITTFGNSIIGVLKIVGSVVAVIMLMVLGFKYMMGSAEDKADYKKSMIPYVVGAICIFAAPFIAGIIFNMANNIK